MNVIIIGGGKVGTRVASLLLTAGHSVKVIENDPEKVVRLQRELNPEVVIQGNGSDPQTLEVAGVRNAHVLATVTGQDETNLVVTSLARFEFGVARTIARVNNPKNAWMFSEQMGVDVAISQADLVAHMILEEM